MSTNGRGGFSTKIGVILATVGAAVGLGNIWRFPYLAGQNGGGAFIFVYLICVVLVGLPILMSEFFIGRSTGQNPKAAFRTLAKNNRWNWYGWLCLICAMLILSFYSVVAGWTAEYFMQSVTGNLSGKSSAELTSMFETFSNDPVRPVFWLVLFLGMTALISLGGIKNGIERVSNILMPVLFVILLLLAGHSLTLSGAQEGLRYMFQPDFSKITPAVVLDAMGQAFFSLSIGMGGIITYASYFSKETNLSKTALVVAGLDTMVALLAGIIIFPVVFSYGISPEQGPELVFISLPNVFNQMPLGSFWASIFFLLLAVAALTSTISMSEVIVTLVHEEYKVSRKLATLFVLVTCSVLGIVCSLSLGIWSGFTIFGKNVFSLFEYLASNILQPIGGAAAALFVGWWVSKTVFKTEMQTGSRIGAKGFGFWYFILKYIAPLGLGIIVLNQFGLLRF